MPNFIRWYLIAIAQILLLCACAITPPTDRSESVSQIVSSGQTNSDSSNKAAADKQFNEHHEITPSQSIEKDGLLISYSMLAIPTRKGFLFRLSLVFRNLQGRNRMVKAKVLLLDASGNKIRAYTKNGFIKLSSSLAGKTSEIVAKSIIKGDGYGKISAESRIEWANAYWLKSNYKIPPQGIAIGEVVYHGTHLDLPMKLTVNSNKQEFVFITKDSLQVIQGFASSDQ